MKYEELKNEFIKLKKEELKYIDSIYKISNNKMLSEIEKLEIYRTLKELNNNLNEKLKEIRKELLTKSNINPSEIIIEFNIEDNCLKDYEEYFLEDLGVDNKTNKFKLSVDSILHKKYCGININNIIQNQKFIDEPIYIFIGYYDNSEDCYGPCFGEPDSYIDAIYYNIYVKPDTYGEYGEKINIPKNKMDDFEKNKIIIKLEKYVSYHDVIDIFNQELLNNKNNTIKDCIKATQKRMKETSYIRSPEYKEKMLLEKINNLYKMVKGEFIKSETLYSGKFLDILRETYNLPNGKIVNKEKVIKNNGKNSVVIIALTQDGKYIITLQNRINNKIITEFPSGYIEQNEDVLEAAQRELIEETGYVSNELSIIDHVYYSPGIDNSIAYIVFASNCLKNKEAESKECELVKYDLFSEKELNYLINNNIMNGAINKLAYYNLICNFNNCNTTIVGKDNQVIKKIFKKEKKRDTSL